MVCSMRRVVVAALAAAVLPVALFASPAVQAGPAAVAESPTVAGCTGPYTSSANGGVALPAAPDGAYTFSTSFYDCGNYKIIRTYKFFSSEASDGFYQMDLKYMCNGTQRYGRWNFSIGNGVWYGLADFTCTEPVVGIVLDGRASRPGFDGDLGPTSDNI